MLENKNNILMFSNVFSETKVVGGEKQLSLKYEPRNILECCCSEKDKLNIINHLEKERYFCVYSHSGNGATVCMKHIANEMCVFFVHQLSCSIGCAEILKLLKQNMKNVLLELQRQSKRILFFIKDFEILKRNERCQIIGVIEQFNINAIIFLNNDLFVSSWKTIEFSQLTFDDKMIHLCWICAEESLDFELEEIERLANFNDLRNAINSLKFSGIVEERDYYEVDNYSKILFAHESLECDNIHDLSIFLDLVCFTNITIHTPAGTWFTDMTVKFMENNSFKYTKKQSFVSRNAQLSHRLSCLRNSCKILSICRTELNLCSKLYRNIILTGNNSIKNDSNYQINAKALYMISKIGASVSECKKIKAALKLK